MPLLPCSDQRLGGCAGGASEANLHISSMWSWNRLVWGGVVIDERHGPCRTVESKGVSTKYLGSNGQRQNRWKAVMGPHGFLSPRFTQSWSLFCEHVTGFLVSNYALDDINVALAPDDQVHPRQSGYENHDSAAGGCREAACYPTLYCLYETILYQFLLEYCSGRLTTARNPISPC